MDYVTIDCYRFVGAIIQVEDNSRPTHHLDRSKVVLRLIRQQLTQMLWTIPITVVSSATVSKVVTRSFSSAIMFSPYVVKFRDRLKPSNSLSRASARPSFDELNSHGVQTTVLSLVALRRLRLSAWRPRV
jgi:hypothetical protein